MKKWRPHPAYPAVDMPDPLIDTKEKRKANYARKHKRRIKKGKGSKHG